MDFKKSPGKRIIKRTEILNHNEPIISIISPFYNGGSEIKETYNSIINQTYPYFEWIIVNDGSEKEKSNKIIEEISSLWQGILEFLKLQKQQSTFFS